MVHFIKYEKYYACLSFVYYDKQYIFRYYNKGFFIKNIFKNFSYKQIQMFITFNTIKILFQNQHYIFIILLMHAKKLFNNFIFVCLHFYFYTTKHIFKIVLEIAFFFY